MTKKRFTCRGMTLVEVSVSMVIMVILIGVSGGIMIAGMNIYWKDAQLRAAQNEGNAVFALLHEKLSYAAGFSVDEYGGLPVELENDQEQLLITERSVTLNRAYNGSFNQQVLFDEAYLHYHRLVVHLTREAEDSAFLTLQVDIFNDEHAHLYSRSGVVPLLNLPYTGAEAYVLSATDNGKPLSILYTYLE